MICLAAMAMAAYFFCIDNFGMNAVPQPIIIEYGNTYSYSEIYSAIDVPFGWAGTCNDQHNLLAYMEQHFNGFRNGNKKFSEAKLQEINKKWICVT